MLFQDKGRAGEWSMRLATAGGVWKVKVLAHSVGLDLKP